jgi:hypothetical protein
VWSSWRNLMCKCAAQVKYHEEVITLIVSEQERLTERMDDVEHEVRTLVIQIDCLESGDS